MNSFEGISKIKNFITNENEYITVTPPNAFKSDMWMLGTSESSTGFAINEKMNFSLSLFHTLNSQLPPPSIISGFKKQFFNKNGYIPNINIAISIFCSNDHNRIHQERITRKNVRLNISGLPEECLMQLDKIQTEYDVEEIIVLNLGSHKTDKELLMQLLKQKVSANKTQQKMNG